MTSPQAESRRQPRPAASWSRSSRPGGRADVGRCRHPPRGARHRRQLIPPWYGTAPRTRRRGISYQSRRQPPRAETHRRERRLPQRRQDPGPVHTALAVAMSATHPTPAAQSIDAMETVGDASCLVHAASPSPAAFSFPDRDAELAAGPRSPYCQQWRQPKGGTKNPGPGTPTLASSARSCSNNKPSPESVARENQDRPAALDVLALQMKKRNLGRISGLVGDPDFTLDWTSKTLVDGEPPAPHPLAS